MARTISTTVGAVTCDMVIDLSGLEGAVEILILQKKAEIVHKAKEWSEDVTLKMKLGAKWTNRTGNARGSLGVVPDPHFVGNLMELFLTGGVKYMFYLETKFAGAFSILGPTLDEEADNFILSIGAERL